MKSQLQLDYGEFHEGGIEPGMWDDIYRLIRWSDVFRGFGELREVLYAHERFNIYEVHASEDTGARE